MLDRLVHSINIIVVIGNIINLIIFPIAVYKWEWQTEDPRLIFLGYIAMFLIGWMVTTYILFMYKITKRRDYIMKNIVDWIKNHTADILIVLGAISAILVNLQSSGVNATWMSITIAIIALAVEVMKHGLSEKAIKLITEAVLIILEAIKKDNAVSNAEVVGILKADVETRLRKAIK